MQWYEKMPKRLSSAAMILKNESDQVLLVKANYKPYWTFPGGIIDEGETPKDAVLRETLEEVGIDVHPDTVDFYAVVDRMSHEAQTYQFLFMAPLGTTMVDHVILQASEIDAYALITKEQVRSHDRVYSQAVIAWAKGEKGYLEQTFNDK